VSLSLAVALQGLLPSAESNCVGFLSGALEIILLSTTIHISGFNNTACKLAPPGFAPSLTGTHAGFATPGRSSGYPPLPPQTRTCPIKASGSSVTAGLSPR
jgi:hypothetical protein